MQLRNAVMLDHKGKWHTFDAGTEHADLPAWARERIIRKARDADDDDQPVVEGEASGPALQTVNGRLTLADPADDYTKAELVDVARKVGVTPGSMTKAELIDALRDAGVHDPDA